MKKFFYIVSGFIAFSLASSASAGWITNKSVAEQLCPSPSNLKFTPNFATKTSPGQITGVSSEGTSFKQSFSSAYHPKKIFGDNLIANVQWRTLVGGAYAHTIDTASGYENIMCYFTYPNVFFPTTVLIMVGKKYT